MRIKYQHKAALDFAHAMLVVCACIIPVENCETFHRCDTWPYPFRCANKATLPTKLPKKLQESKKPVVYYRTANVRKHTLRVKQCHDRMFILATFIIIFFVMPGECSQQIPTLKDNCTCVTSQGTYSLYPLRSTGENPRFETQQKGYTYTYNPCVPYTKSSKKGICKNVALCKYDTDGSPHVYIDIGEQRAVMCDIEDSKIALIYPINNTDVPRKTSQVILECNETSGDKFNLIDADAMIFSLTSRCGCPNGCKPGPTPTKIGPYVSTSPSSSPETPSSKPEELNWKLVILLPSVAAFVVMVICFICLWRRLPVIQRALLCRCCHCHDNRRDERVERNATETSSLIKNELDNRAIEHEDILAKGKIKEPVQVEDGHLEEGNKFPGKSDRTVVV